MKFLRPRTRFLPSSLQPGFLYRWLQISAKLSHCVYCVSDSHPSFLRNFVRIFSRHIYCAWMIPLLLRCIGVSSSLGRDGMLIRIKVWQMIIWNLVILSHITTMHYYSLNFGSCAIGPTLHPTVFFR